LALSCGDVEEITIDALARAIYWHGLISTT
jgi:hypothetical protein